MPLLHRIGFVYKKAKGLPSRADVETQKKFIQKYRRLRKNLGKRDKIYFVDSTHPTFNTQLSYGWIKKGKEAVVPMNSGRHRINIQGAYDPVNHKTICEIIPKVNYRAAIRFFRKIERRNPKAKRIYLILDQATYYRSKKVKEYLARSKIRLKFLPAYSPNLNLIERLWRLMKKKALNNRYHETVNDFRYAVSSFLRK